MPRIGRCTKIPISRATTLGGIALLVLALATLAAPAQKTTPAPKPAPEPKPSPVLSDQQRAALALDQKVLAEAKKGSEVMANLTHLSDIIGPRLTGSAALKKANDWAAEKMKSYGLTNVHLEPWEMPVGWERGPASARIIEPNNGRTLTLAALGWTPGTKGKVEAEVVILKAKNRKELNAYKGKLKNAVILRNPPATVRSFTDTATPPTRPTTPRTPPRGGPRPSAEFQRELREFLHAEGVAALLSDSGKPHGLLTTTGSWRGRERVGATEPLPALVVAHEHYALLYRLASRPAPARTRITLEVSNKFVPGPITVYNTVGEIRGSEKPDEYVIIGAHLDSWDLAQGTTDNGTGSVVVLETARILVRSGIKPRRTIRFVLFTGEEQGLHGSRAYVKRHKDELARTSLCLVHDTGTGKVIGLGLQRRKVLEPLLQAELTSLKEVGFKGVNLRSMGGSDHMAFEQVGVPGFAVQQDMGEYRFTHHSQSDTLDKAHEPDLIQGAEVLAVTALRVANLPKLLPRDKPTDGKPTAGKK